MQTNVSTENYSKSDLMEYLKEMINSKQIFDITIYSGTKIYGFLTGISFNSDSEVPETISFGIFEPKAELIGICAIKDTELLNSLLPKWVSMFDDNVCVIPYNAALHMN